MKLTLALTILFIHHIFAVSDKQWEDHKKKYNLEFDEKEDKERRQNYEQVDALITTHNAEAVAGKHTWTMKHNNASHWSDEERKSRHGHRSAGSLDIQTRASTYAENFTEPLERAKLPDSVDWRKSGCVSPIQNQGQCGSCWTFSATATLESAYCISTGKLVKLSEQNLVDCARRADTNRAGCDGGDVRVAWDYVAGTGGNRVGFFYGNNAATLPKPVPGQDTAEAYPYTGEDGECRFDRNAACVTSVTWKGSLMPNPRTWHSVTPGDNQALKEAVTKFGVLSVSVYFPSSFFHYAGGVIPPSDCISPTGDGTNHAVNLIGYGSDGGGAYWLLRNSYGTDWGENGYFRLKRSAGSAQGLGTCNMLKYPYYVKAAATSTCNIQRATSNTNCYQGKGVEYIGEQDKAMDGSECFKWKDIKLFSDLDFPDGSKGSKGDAKNYCRNPQGRRPMPWCFFKKSAKGNWLTKPCDVPKCSATCFDINKDYKGNDIETRKNVRSAAACQRECQKESKCAVWTWGTSGSKHEWCWLKTHTETEDIKESDNRVSGPRYCPVVCADKRQDCQTLDDDSRKWCTRFPIWMATWCRKTCNKCPAHT